MANKKYKDDAKPFCDGTLFKTLHWSVILTVAIIQLSSNLSASYEVTLIDASSI